MLMDTKQTLDAEIAIYRKMLEGEENRTGLRQLVEQVVKTHSLQQQQDTGIVSDKLAKVVFVFFRDDACCKGRDCHSDELPAIGEGKCQHLHRRPRRKMYYSGKHWTEQGRFS